MLWSHTSYALLWIANINCTVRVEIWCTNFSEKPTFEQRAGGSLGYWVSFIKIHSILVLELATLQQVNCVQSAWNVLDMGSILCMGVFSLSFPKLFNNIGLGLFFPTSISPPSFGYAYKKKNNTFVLSSIAFRLSSKMACFLKVYAGTKPKRKKMRSVWNQNKDKG